MIIKRYRLRARWSLRRFRKHVFQGRENEAIRVLRGSELDVDDFQAAARSVGATYGVRHFIIAPEVETSEDALLQVLQLLAEEFDFDPALVVAVLHRKKRRTGTGCQHLHVLVPEVNLISGGVLGSSQDFLRQERIAREAEHKLHHPFQRGRHLPSVLGWLKKQNPSVHDALLAVFPDAQPSCREAFSSKNAGRVKREAGLDLPSTKSFLKTVWERSRSVVMVESAVMQLGCTLQEGDKSGVLILRHGDILIGSLHRLLGEKLGTIRKEFGRDGQRDAENGKPEPRSDDPPRNLGNAPGNKLDDGCARTSRKRRRSRGGSSGAIYSESSSCGPHGHDDISEEPRSSAPKGRSAALAVADAALGCMSLEDRVQLEAQLQIATNLAMTGHQRFFRWCEEKVTIIDNARNGLEPDRVIEAERVRLLKELEATREAIKSWEREYSKAESAIRRAEEGKDVGPRRWFEFFRRRTEKTSVPSEFSIALAHPEKRLQALKDYRSSTLSALRKLENREENRAYQRELTRPSRLASADRNMRALDTIKRRLLQEPDFAFSGPDAFEKLFRMLVENVGAGEGHVSDPSPAPF